MRDVIRVADENAETFDRRRLRTPQADVVIVGAGRQHAGVVAQGHAIDATLVLVQGLKKRRLVASSSILRRCTTHR